MNRFLKIFITCSVLMNLLLAGMVIGHVSGYMMEPHRHQSVQEIAQSLPPELRGRFEQAMQRAEQDTARQRQQLDDLRKKGAAILKAEPFDKTAYLAQMQQVQQLHEQIMRRMIEGVADLALQSSVQERAILAGVLRHPPHPSSAGE